MTSPSVFLGDFEKCILKVEISFLTTKMFSGGNSAQEPINGILYLHWFFQSTLSRVDLVLVELFPARCIIFPFSQLRVSGTDFTDQCMRTDVWPKPVGLSWLVLRTWNFPWGPLYSGKGWLLGFVWKRVSMGWWLLQLTVKILDIYSG